jgi:hypothetical protein
MAKIDDVEDLQDIRSTGNTQVFGENVNMFDLVIIPLYILTHTWVLYGRMWALFSSVLFGILYIGGYFELSFITIVFVSFFVADLLITQRILRTADSRTQTYATLALTFVFIVFFIMLLTGGIEPYQGALASLVLYIAQANYRTSSLTMSSAQSEGSVNKNN